MKTLDPSTIAEAFHHVVRSRRSIRRFEPEPVPEDTIREALELAILAPNSSNLQPWAFYWVRGGDNKAALAQICFSQNAAKTASDLIVIVGKPDDWREHSRALVEQWPEETVPPIVRRYYSRVAPLLYAQGPLGLLGPVKRLVFTVLGWFRPAPRDYCSPGALKRWAAVSAALAAGNLMLALQAHGYDSCPMEGFDARRLRRFLGLRGNAFPVMIIAVGKAAPKGVYNERFRFSLDTVLHRL